MFLYLCVEIKHCQTGRALQNEKGKAGTFIRVLKKTFSPADVPTKLHYNISTRWNVKCWCFLVNYIWPCFWAAELWIASKWLSVRGDCTQNQPTNVKTRKIWCYKSYCHLASATSLLLLKFMKSKGRSSWLQLVHNKNLFSSFSLVFLWFS